MIILVISLIIIMKVYYSNEDVARLRYINSSKVNNDYLMIPYKMNMVYSAYSGEVLRVTIEKSVYHFAKEVVPNYREIFTTSNLKPVIYFEQNKFAIGVDTGVDNSEDFKKMIEGICLLDNDLKIETYEFSDQRPSTTSSSLNTKLLIKYKNNKRIIFKVKISKEILKSISSIRYSFERIEK